MFRTRSDNPFASAEWDGVLGLAQDRYADWSNRIQQGLESWGELEKQEVGFTQVQEFLMDVSGQWWWLSQF